MGVRVGGGGSALLEDKAQFYFRSQVNGDTVTDGE